MNKLNVSPFRQYTQASKQAPAPPGGRTCPHYVKVPVIEVPLTEARDICDPSADQETELLARERHRIVGDILASLDQEQRTLILARFASGHTLIRIAADEGVSKATIHARLKKALILLRVSLRSRGIGRIEEMF